MDRLLVSPMILDPLGLTTQPERTPALDPLAITTKLLPDGEAGSVT